MADCTNKKSNNQKCPCTYSGCSHHGICCECLHSHLSRRELPACAFTPDAEKTYDRSFRKFIETWS